MSSLIVTISGVNADGFGIARHGDLEVLVAGGTREDRLRVQIRHTSPQARRAWADIIEVVLRGSDFREAACHHAWPLRGRCGGCPHMHLTEEGRAAEQAGWVAEALTPGGPEVASKGDAAPAWASRLTRHAAPEALAYRNRANFVVGRRGARIVLGSYAPRTHDIAAMDGCLALRPPLTRVMADLRRALETLAPPIWPDPDGLRYASMRTNRGGEVLIELIVGAESAWQADLLRDCERIKAVVGVALSTNATPGNALRVAPPIMKRGRLHITEKVGPITLFLAAETFFQLNTDVAERIYGRATELLGGGEVVWDLYCGIGGLGLTAAAQGGRRVWGADVSAESVARARQAAKHAGVDVTYAVQSLADGVPAGWPRPDAVFVNPPRRGLDAAVRQALGASGAERIIYVSCNPSTFARDVGELGAHGYAVEQVEMFDMLPQTGHVELVGLLSRK